MASESNVKQIGVGGAILGMILTLAVVYVGFRAASAGWNAGK